jgi:hypothetical protein
MFGFFICERGAKEASVQVDNIDVTYGVGSQENLKSKAPLKLISSLILLRTAR